MRKVIGGAVLVLVSVAGCGDEYDATPSKNTAGRSSAGSSGSGGDEQGHAGGESTQPLAGSGGDGGAAAGAGGAGGEAGESAAGAAGAPEPSSTTVRGKLRNGLLPLPNVLVLVDGKSTLTDENGEYTFEDVAPAYQLVFILEDPQVVNVYDGLTTRQPVTNMPLADTPHTASITGKLAGGGIPIPAGHRGSVAFSASAGAFFESEPLLAGAESYALGSIGWSGAATLEGELQALEWEDGADGPESYTGFASKLFTLQAGESHGAADGSVPATNLDLIDPAEETVSGSITIPASLDLVSTELNVGRFAIPASLDAGPFSLVVPTLPAAPSLAAFVSVLAQGSDVGHSQVRVERPASGEWTIDVPKPPQLVQPISDAQDVDTTTEFKWSGVPANIVVYATWRVGDWTIYRTTSATTATLPDLSDQGMVYESGATGSWEVTGMGPAATVDDLMALEDKTYVSSQPFTLWSQQSASRTLRLAD